MSGASVSHADGLGVGSKHDGDTIAVTFSGVAELPAVGRLGEFLRALHVDAVDSHVKEVVADFNHLEFMNSSCFKMFVSWIISIQDQPADKQYRVRIRQNEQILWQRRSMHALQGLAPELIELEH